MPQNKELMRGSRHVFNTLVVRTAARNVVGQAAKLLFYYSISNLFGSPEAQTQGSGRLACSVQCFAPSLSRDVICEAK